MSRQGSQEHAVDETSEGLDVIREEVSPAASVIDVPPPVIKPVSSSCAPCCECKKEKPLTIEVEKVEKLLKEKEEQLTAEFNERLINEINMIKERADFILQNEQVRASYMLREAHRERHEKIAALQTQLECKNLAGLMYVMCTERRKSKMEKLAIIEEYSNYVITLQDILAEAQTLILNLSRGYKTAARVDNEWREKMKKTLLEFQTFIHDFMKGAPESDQYFFDFPELLKTKSPIVENPATDDPCTCDDDDNIVVEEENEEKPWYERLDTECRPFVMFGDMADFKPPQRREVLRAQKVKMAPRKWKDYVFRNMFVNAECKNADAIKDVYFDCMNEPTPTRWEGPSGVNNDLSTRQSTQFGYDYRRQTTQSVDLRGGMGSILKLITSTIVPQPPVNKALLLGARDSMEIASTTKLKGEKHIKSVRKFDEPSKVVINIGKRRTSMFENSSDFIEEDDEAKTTPGSGFTTKPSSYNDYKGDNRTDDEDDSALGSTHNDSLTTMANHRRERDHKINYEKVCPMEKCQRLQVDSFTRSLPAYMRANPFMHYEQSFDEYEACSKEQLEILCERIAKKKKEEKADVLSEEDPLNEWTSIEGVAVQTSDISMSVPECTCRAPNPSTTSSHEGQVFNVEELYPMKQILNEINRDCFFDSGIQFDRFKVIGEESSETMRQRKDREQNKKKNRLYEVQKVLKQHPSLLDIFQANAV